MPTLEPVTPSQMLHAFTGYGIELEYMIVGQTDLVVRPLADRLLLDAEGAVVNEIGHGALAWSNELVQHVIELKTNGPASALAGLADTFHADLRRIQRELAAHDARLLPTAMHPLFDPERETRLWPYGQNDIYAAYDRIFGCRGHGWSNLQSMHINLPFFDDAEFRRLHAAIRVVLPLLPALAAASPLEQGRAAGWLDNRLRYYRDNQRRIPEISGLVIPEPVDGIDDYHAVILAPMYRAIAPHDPDGVLADDWLNSRGAIARFERQTIEIRTLDLQECPAADLAIAELTVALVRAFYEERFAPFAAQQALATEHLAELHSACAEQGSRARVDDPAFLKLFGLPGPVSAGGAWRRLLALDLDISPTAAAILDRMVSRGSLAEAIMARLALAPGQAPERAAILDCYAELAACLVDNRLFQS